MAKRLIAFGALIWAMKAIPMSFSDLLSDVLATKKNLNSPVDVVKYLGFSLVFILVVHSIVSSIYGLCTLRRNPTLYPLLWGSRFRQCLTCLLHLVGLGAVAYHLNSITEKLINDLDDGSFIRRQLLRLRGGAKVWGKSSLSLISLHVCGYVFRCCIDIFIRG